MQIIFSKKTEEVKKLQKEEYQKLSDKTTKNSTMLKDCIWAFIIGGLICVVGQALFNLYTQVFMIDEETARILESVSLVFLSALFTGVGLYDALAKHAGAGTLVPITGFANAVVSPAMEFKAEGLVLGMAPKMFIIAGPVIVFGVTASVIYGVIFYLIQMFM